MFTSPYVRAITAGTIAVAAVAVFYARTEPMPQPLWYHGFADQRTLFGVPHALNVLSNLPFVVIGLLGMAFLASSSSRRPGIFLEEGERWPYWMFFVGMVVTGIGSTYYHANPTNDTLVWDRASLAITLMALFTSVLVERVHVSCRWCLVPLVSVGVGSVFYWSFTEHAGAGDMRPYLAVQFLPLILVPLMLLCFPARYTRGGDLVAALLCYGIAKLLETFDGQVYTAAGFVSGHTLKHLVAAMGGVFVILMLMHRRPTSPS
jgi:hypothetical protein